MPAIRLLVRNPWRASYPEPFVGASGTDGNASRFAVFLVPPETGVLIFRTDV